MAFASWWYKTHVSEKTSESPSKPGEKKGSDEKKAASLGSSRSSRTYAGGTASATKVSASSGATSKSSSMNPTETKAVKTEPEKKSQSTKLSVVHEKKSQEGKPKENTEQKSLPKPASDTGSKDAHNKKQFPDQLNSSHQRNQQNQRLNHKTWFLLVERALLVSLQHLASQVTRKRKEIVNPSCAS